MIAMKMADVMDKVEVVIETCECVPLLAWTATMMYEMVIWINLPL